MYKGYGMQCSAGVVSLGVRVVPFQSHSMLGAQGKHPVYMY